MRFSTAALIFNAIPFGSGRFLGSARASAEARQSLRPALLQLGERFLLGVAHVVPRRLVRLLQPLGHAARLLGLAAHLRDRFLVVGLHLGAGLRELLLVA